MYSKTETESTAKNGKQTEKNSRYTVAFQSELACKPLLGFSQFPWLYIISGHFGG
jgi:hypothetical protein